MPTMKPKLSPTSSLTVRKPKIFRTPPTASYGRRAVNLHHVYSPEEAFKIADADNSGMIDEQEFE